MASEYKRAKNRAWKWFSLYIRARDCIKTTGSISRGKCVTCGKEFNFKDLQAGHFVQGRNNAVLFNELGVNAQCLTKESQLKMADGSYKNIDRIKVGDKLLAFNEKTFESEVAIVKNCKSFLAKDLYKVVLEDGRVFYCTGEHRVVANGAFREIRSMLHSVEAYDIMEDMKMFDKTKHTEYYIDRDGRIYSKGDYSRSEDKKNKIIEIKPNVNRKRGYLYARTKNRNWSIHRLVAKFFVENPLNKKYVNHKDGNKHNNNFKNLEWVTPKENMQHARKNGLMRYLRKNEGNIKYTNEQVKEVYNRVKSGMKYIEAGSIYNMPYSTVAHIIRGSRRKIV